MAGPFPWYGLHVGFWGTQGSQVLGETQPFPLGCQALHREYGCVHFVCSKRSLERLIELAAGYLGVELVSIDVGSSLWVEIASSTE